jgi:DNA polymerase III epsilon subunit family exonuclease
MTRRKHDPRAQQLDLTALLTQGLEIDLSERAHKGIAVRLKTDEQQSWPAEPAADDAAPASRSALAPTPGNDATPTEVRYRGLQVVNGRVIREGRHSDSQWNYVGLAGALPKRIYDYHPDVVLERRADLDGRVRLLPIRDTPGEPLPDLEYVVVDVETTGVGFSLGHRITEVAIVRVSGAGRVLDAYTTLVNPERPIPAMITALTNISGAMVRTAPRFRDIAADVFARLEGRIFVAHNAGFDWRFLSLEMQAARGQALHGRMLCTVRMARKLVPEMPRRSLDALAWYFGIENEARHRAFGDAQATAQLFARLMGRIEERAIRGWNELQKLLYARAPRRVRRSSPQFFDPLA